MGAGNLGAPPNPPWMPVEGLRQARYRRVELSSLDIGAPRLHVELLPQVRGQLPALLDHLVAPGPIRLGDGGQHAGKAGHPVPVLGRKVGAAEERLERGGQEDAHRPAAAAGHGLHRGHVDVVQVGALLAVDLDRHEVAVQLLGDGRVLERLVRHDVAPVTGRIADRQEDRLVLDLRPLERLSAPGIPVDRVVRVLEEVRARLGGQSVGDPGAAKCRRSRRSLHDRPGPARGAGPGRMLSPPAASGPTAGSRSRSGALAARRRCTAGRGSRCPIPAARPSAAQRDLGAVARQRQRQGDGGTPHQSLHEMPISSSVPARTMTALAGVSADSRV